MSAWASSSLQRNTPFASVSKINLATSSKCYVKYFRNASHHSSRCICATSTSNTGQHAIFCTHCVQQHAQYIPSAFQYQRQMSSFTALALITNLSAFLIALSGHASLVQQFSLLTLCQVCVHTLVIKVLGHCGTNILFISSWKHSKISLQASPRNATRQTNNEEVQEKSRWQKDCNETTNL